MTAIRRCEEADWPAMWSLLLATFETGDTYAFSPQSTEAEIHAAWMEAPRATYVVREGDGGNGRVLGTYFIKPNQPGLARMSATAVTWWPPKRKVRAWCQRCASTRSAKQ
jgi:hypothetical protein